MVLRNQEAKYGVMYSMAARGHLCLLLPSGRGTRQTPILELHRLFFRLYSVFFYPLNSEVACAKGY